MDSHKLHLLKKKLEALHYKEHVDASSAPLVDRIVSDLLHTTDSYRDIKLQLARRSQDLEDHRNQVGCANLGVHTALFPQKSACLQVEGLTRDASRLSAENNQLHLQLLKTADVADQAEKQHYQHTKQLEGQITELACWKHQTAGRFQTLEKENSGLRAKLEDLLRLGERFPRRRSHTALWCKFPTSCF